MTKPTRAFSPVMIGQNAATGSLSVVAPFGSGTSAQRAVRVVVYQIGTLISSETLPTPTIGGVALTPIGTQYTMSSDQGIARAFGLLGATIPGSSPTVEVTGANVNRRLQMAVHGWEGATQITDGAITSQTGTSVEWTILDADSDSDTIIDIALLSTHQTATGGNPWTAPLPAVAGANGSTAVDQSSAYTGCNRQLALQEDAAGSGTTVLGLTYTDSQFGSSETLGPTFAVKGATASGPTIGTQPSPQTANAGAVATFTGAATAAGGGTLSYQWRANGVDIVGATSTTYLRTVTVADNGVQISFIVTETGGSSPGNTTSSNALLTVNAVVPTVVTHPSNATVTEGATASFTVAFAGNPTPTVQWQRDAVNINGANALTYSLTTVLADNGAAFRCVATNSGGANNGGTVTTNAATLTVNAGVSAPSITVQPAAVESYVGLNAEFSVTAAGTAPLVYQWRKDGVDILGETSATYTRTAVTADDSGAVFTCYITNAHGNVTSAGATLTVAEAPTDGAGVLIGVSLLDGAIIII